MFYELKLLKETDFDKMFDDMFEKFEKPFKEFTSLGKSFTKSDFVLDKDSEKLIIRLELPGTKKEDIAIDYEADVIKVVSKDYRGKENVSKFAINSGLYRGGPFDINNVNAKYSDGLLTITIPKAVITKEKKVKINIQ